MQSSPQANTFPPHQESSHHAHWVTRLHPQPQATDDLLSISTACPFRTFHIDGITQYVVFGVWLLPCFLLLLKFIHEASFYCRVWCSIICKKCSVAWGCRRMSVMSHDTDTGMATVKHVAVTGEGNRRRMWRNWTPCWWECGGCNQTASGKGRQCLKKSNTGLPATPLLDIYSSHRKHRSPARLVHEYLQQHYS